MTRYLFAPPAPASLPIQGSDARFPVGRIFCVGRNYHAHAIEMGAPVDKASMQPFYFIKDAGSLVESGASLPYPPGTRDYQDEMELVVAIGASGFRVAEADAPSLVWGYACGLDMTRRDLQRVAREAGKPASHGIWPRTSRAPRCSPGSSRRPGPMCCSRAPSRCR